MIGIIFAYPFVDYFTYSSSISAVIVAINIGFLIGIPIIGIILFVIRLLYGSRLSLRSRISLNALWALNLISLLAVAALTGRQFQQGNRISINTDLHYNGDTLALNVMNYQHPEEFHMGPLSFQDNQLVSQNIEINVLPGEVDFFEIKQEHSARGFTESNARALAESIQYSPVLNNNTLTFPQEFSINKGQKWRNQKVRLTIYVPKGKYLSMGKNVQGFVHDFKLDKDTEQPWPHDDRIWKMEDNGFVCPDYIDQYNRKSQLDYQDFSQLMIEGKMKVLIEKGDQYSVKLTGKEVYTKKVDVVKMNNLLTISTDLQRTNSPIRLHIVTPQLQSLVLEQTDDVKIQGFDEKNLLIKNNGRGDIKAFINVDSLTVRQIGKNELDLRGKGNYLNADLTDNAQLDAEHFAVDFAEYTAKGRSRGKIAVAKQVRQRLEKGSRLTLDGEPEVLEY